MPNMTVRNLPEDVHRRVRFIAAQRGISTEAAARQLLDEASRPAEAVGTLLADHMRGLGVDFPEVPRSTDAPRAADFE